MLWTELTYDNLWQIHTSPVLKSTGDFAGIEEFEIVVDALVEG
jgi:hypothetical protein